MEQQNQDLCSYAIHFPTSPTLPLLTDILTFVTSLSQSYIWHKQPFNLSLSPVPFASTSAPTIEFLEGKVNCTDCVDDEWFVVWLLKQISIEWPTAVISIEDADGEFMLIEAAEVLPKWVTPSNATNRVSTASPTSERVLMFSLGMDPSSQASPRTVRSQFSSFFHDQFNF